MSNAGIWKESTPYSKLLITVGIVLVSAVFFTMVAMLVTMIQYQVSYAQLEILLKDMNNPYALSVLKMVQIFLSVGAFVIPPFILAYLFSSGVKQYLFLQKGISAADVFLLLTLMIAAIPLINFLSDLNSRMILPSFLSWLEDWIKQQELLAKEFTERVLSNMSGRDLALNLFMVAVIPALGEELLFRGIIQRIFSDWTKNVHWGIWISAAFFSAVHVQFYGFVPRMLLGALLGYMLLWSGSLWLPIIAHFINNASAVVMIYLYRNSSISIDPDKVGAEGDSFSALVIGTLFLVVALWLLYKKHRPVKTE